MKIFIDTADLDEIKKAQEWGIVDGVTTNPSLIKKAVEKRKKRGEKIDMESYIEEICGTVDGPVSLEVTAIKYEGMVEEAKTLYNKFNPVNPGNVVIKIPVSPSIEENDERLFDGIKAIKDLTDVGIPTNATLVMTPEQALLAMKAGASYVSPFVGRVDDYIRKEKLKMKNFGKYDLFDSSIVKRIEEIRRDKAIEEELKTSEKMSREKKKELKKIGIEPGSYEELYEIASRIDLSDNGIYDGTELVESILKIKEAYGFSTEIIAASIRTPYQVRKVAELGVDIATIPFAVLKKMIDHPKTREGMKKFSEDVVPEYAEIFK